MSDPNEAPPVIEESLQGPHVVEKRAFGGWIILIILFGLLIPGSLVASLSPHKGPKNYMTEQTVLGQMVRVKQLTSILPASSPAPTKNPLLDEFEDARKDVGKQPLAARVIAVADHETGRKLEPEVATALENSADPVDAALGRIYTTEPLSKEDASRAISDLPDDMFMYRLAKVHAKEESGMEPTGRQELISPAKLVGQMLAALLLGLASLAGVAVWIVFFALRSNGTLKPAGLPPAPLSAADADRLAWKAALMLAAFVVLSEIGAAAGLGKISPALGLLPPVIVIGMLFAIDKAPIAGRLVTLRYQGLSLQNLPKHFLWAICGLCAELPIALGLSVLAVRLLKGLPPPSHPASTLLQSNQSFIVLAVVTLLASIMAPFWEELCFRGSIFPALSRFVGIVPSALLSSFLFAAIHPQGIALWLGLGTIAAVSCVLVYYTRSLVPSIMMHAMHNTLILVYGLTTFV